MLNAMIAEAVQAERERLTDAAMKAAEKGIDTAIALEREACANLRKEVALLGKRSTEYEEGFWEGLSKYEDLIRARGQA
jgi:hypothetical protein